MFRDWVATYIIIGVANVVGAVVGLTTGDRRWGLVNAVGAAVCFGLAVRDIVKAARARRSRS